MKTAPIESPKGRPSWDVPKLRACLRCESTFESEWSGQRICPSCKGSAAWRSGAPLPPRSAGRGG